MTQCALSNGKAWSDNAITANWRELQRALPPQWLPHLQGTATLTRRPVYEQYDCGHYGCVYPTGDPRVVFKITTDESEARFIALARDSQPPDGVVKYEFLARLSGDRRRTVWGRQDVRHQYVVVREAADYVGKLEQVTCGRGADKHDCYDARVALGRLQTFKQTASLVRTGINSHRDLLGEVGEYVRRHGQPRAELLDAADLRAKMQSGHASPRHVRAEDERRLELGRLYPEEVVVVVPSEVSVGQRAAELLSALEELSLMMENEPIGHCIGQALGYYLMRHMLLADVHANNIGLVTREGRKLWVITDPGHLVELREFGHVEIPHILEMDNANRR